MKEAVPVAGAAFLRPGAQGGAGIWKMGSWSETEKAAGDKVVSRRLYRRVNV